MRAAHTCSANVSFVRRAVRAFNAGVRSTARRADLRFENQVGSCRAKFQKAARLMLTRTIELEHEQSLTLNSEPGTRIKVIYGWVRLAGSCESGDRLLGSREEAGVQVPRRSVIRSIGKTRIELIEAKRSHRLQRWPERLRRWLRLRAAPRPADRDGTSAMR